MALSPAEFRSASSRIDLDDQPTVSLQSAVAAQRGDGPQDLSFHPTKALLAVGSITGETRLLACRPLLDAHSDSPADIDTQFEGEVAEKATLKPAVYYTSVLAFLRQPDSAGGA